MRYLVQFVKLNIKFTHKGLIQVSLKELAHQSVCQGMITQKTSSKTGDSPETGEDGTPVQVSLMSLVPILSDLQSSLLSVQPIGWEHVTVL